MISANAQPIPRIGIAGVGLIGGSLALGLRRSWETATLIGWDLSSDVAEGAKNAGVLHDVVDSLDALVSRVDVLVLAPPTSACASLLEQALSSESSGCVITDVASVKGPLMKVAEKFSAERTRFLVPGHPIAGSERSGYEAARADLFANHGVILTPGDDTDSASVDVVKRMWRAVGASVYEMPAKDHDAILARTSHLPHMLAFALVQALASHVDRDAIFRHAAGGFRDFTRIASSNPIMWRDIALNNPDALLDSMDEFERQLQELRLAIADGDGQALEHFFRDAKHARDEFARSFDRRHEPASPEVVSNESANSSSSDNELRSDSGQIR
ncbi:MAG: prephenate dehydrogenase/arogenate dehydrogenase family protein [Pseudomonadota bacterium]